MTRDLLLAEELALVAIKERSGRHGMGAGAQLNACLAGLLLAELVLDGHARPGDGGVTLVATESSGPRSPMLVGAAAVLAMKGPKIKAVLSHMDRGLGDELGRGTWDTAVEGLVDAGFLSPAEGGRRRRHVVVDGGRRDRIVTRLRGAAEGDGPLEPRTAVLLSMAGPAHLLEVVAPERGGRRHARDRIDHAVDGTVLEPIGKVVRKLIEEAVAAAAG